MIVNTLRNLLISSSFMTISSPCKLTNSIKSSTSIKKSLVNLKINSNSITSSSTWPPPFTKIYWCSSMKSLSNWYCSRINYIKIQHTTITALIKATPMIQVSCSPMRKNKYTENWLSKYFICKTSSQSPMNPNLSPSKSMQSKKSTILEADTSTSFKNSKWSAREGLAKYIELKIDLTPTLMRLKRLQLIMKTRRIGNF